ncbi:MAG TPA: chorismate mutase [Gemmatimonadaceae bacterium]
MIDRSGIEPGVDPSAKLAACREEIERIDSELIALLARRIAVARRTTALKRAAGLPLLDPAREATVIRRAVEQARRHDLPAEDIRAVYWQVVGLSRRVQEESV